MKNKRLKILLTGIVCAVYTGINAAATSNQPVLVRQNNTLYKHNLLNVLYNLKTEKDIKNMMLVNEKLADTIKMVKRKPFFVKNFDLLPLAQTADYQVTTRELKFLQKIKDAKLESNIKKIKFNNLEKPKFEENEKIRNFGNGVSSNGVRNEVSLEIVSLVPSQLTHLLEIDTEILEKVSELKISLRELYLSNYENQKLIEQFNKMPNLKKIRIDSIDNEIYSEENFLGYLISVLQAVDFKKGIEISFNMISLHSKYFDTGESGIDLSFSKEILDNLNELAKKPCIENIFIKTASQKIANTVVEMVEMYKNKGYNEKIKLLFFHRLFKKKVNNGVMFEDEISDYVEPEHIKNYKMNGFVVSKKYIYNDSLEHGGQLLRCLKLEDYERALDLVKKYTKYYKNATFQYYIPGKKIYFTFLDYVNIMLKHFEHSKHDHDMLVELKKVLVKNEAVSLHNNNVDKFFDKFNEIKNEKGQNKKDCFLDFISVYDLNVNFGS